MTRIGRLALVLLILAVLVAGLAIALRFGALPPDSTSRVDLDPAFPNPDTTPMQPRVRELVNAARAAVVADPHSPEAWGRYGMACDAHELLAEAQRCYSRAATLAPEDFRWHYLLAYTIDMRGGDPDRIVAEYQAAAAIRPHFPPVFHRLGEAYARQGRLVEARAAYERAQYLDPQQAVSHRDLAQILLATGEVEAAIDHFEKAASLALADDYTVYAGLAQAYRQRGEPGRAEEAAAKAQSTRNTLTLPDPLRREVDSIAVNAQVAYDRALLRVRAGDHAGAIPDLEIVAEVRPEDPDVHYLLGRAYYNVGRIEPTETHLRKAIALSPQPAAAHASLGEAYIGAGRVDEGLSHLRRAVELVPDEAWLHARLASGLAHAGDLREAVAQYEQALALDPELAQAHLGLGQTKERLGLVEEAVEHYRAALRFDPDSPARQRLQDLGAQ